MAPFLHSLLANIEQLNLIALWVLTELCAVVWIVLLLRCRRVGWQRSVQSPEAPWGLIDLWIVVLIWFAVASGAALLNRAFSPDRARIGLLSGIASLLSTGLGAAWLAIRYRSRAIRFFRSTNWRRDIGIGLLAFIAIIPPIFWLMGLLVRFLPYHHETLEQIKASPTPLVLIASFFSAAVAAPIGEEFFFRLVLQSWLQRLRWRDQPDHRQACLYGDVVRSEQITGSDPADEEKSISALLPEAALKVGPIVASSAAFAALHLGQGPAPIALFLLGLGLGALYARFGSIYSCIVLHASMNLYSLTWESLAAIEHAARSMGS